MELYNGYGSVEEALEACNALNDEDREECLELEGEPACYCGDCEECLEREAIESGVIIIVINGE